MLLSAIKNQRLTEFLGVVSAKHNLFAESELVNNTVMGGSCKMIKFSKGATWGFARGSWYRQIFDLRIGIIIIISLFLFHIRKISAKAQIINRYI